MPSLQSELGKEKGKAALRINPLTLLISIIRENSDKQDWQHKLMFSRMMKAESYAEYVEIVVLEWLNLKYSTAHAAAFPPSQKDIDKQNVERMKRAAVTRAEIKKMKAKIVGKLLQVVMPNGKPLAQCTGAECLAFGGWLTRIGEQIEPHEIVGKVLTESALTKLLA